MTIIKTLILCTLNYPKFVTIVQVLEQFKILKKKKEKKMKRKGQIDQHILFRLRNNENSHKTFPTITTNIYILVSCY